MNHQPWTHVTSISPTHTHPPFREMFLFQPRLPIRMARHHPPSAAKRPWLNPNGHPPMAGVSTLSWLLKLHPDSHPFGTLFKDGRFRDEKKNQPWCFLLIEVVFIPDIVFWDLDVSKNRATPKWMVYNGSNPIKMDHLGEKNLFSVQHPFSGMTNTLSPQTLISLLINSVVVETCIDRKSYAALSDFFPRPNFNPFLKSRTTSWWFQPNWKILVKLGIFPK